MPAKIRLAILGADEDVPRLLTALGRALDGQAVLVYRPREGEALLVHQVRKQPARIWRNQTGAPPSRPAEAVTEAEAVQFVKRIKAGPPPKGPALLKGAWSGALILNEDTVELTLERRLTSYGTLRISGQKNRWIAAFERSEKWFTSATKKEIEKPSLQEAIRAGYAEAQGLIAEACVRRDTHRRAAVDSEHAAKHPAKPPRERKDPTERFQAAKKAPPAKKAPASKKDAAKTPPAAKKAPAPKKDAAKKAPAAKKDPAPAPKPKRAPKASRANQVATALGELGVKATPASHDSGPRLDRVVVRLEDPADLDRLSRKLDVLAFAIGTDAGAAVSMSPGPGDRQVSLFVPRPRASWTVPGGKELRSWKPPRSSVLPACFGVDVRGKPFWLDLGAPSHGHVLIGGASGSGKSAVLHTLLASVLLHRPQTGLVLIDPKQVELAAYSTLAPVASTPAAVKSTLTGLVEEMERRYTALRKAGLQHVGQQRETGHMLAVVEELAELLMVGPEAQDLLVRLAQKGRAAGIHLVCTTQRPDATILRGLLRANLDTRVALNVAKAADSKIIIDEAGAERLTRPGDLLLKVAGGVPQRLHGVLLTPADVAGVVGGLKQRPKAA